MPIYEAMIVENRVPNIRFVRMNKVHPRTQGAGRIWASGPFDEDAGPFVVLFSIERSFILIFGQLQHADQVIGVMSVG